MGYLDQFLNFMLSLPGWLVYIILGISAFVENVFPPIPGDTITAFGAFMVGAGKIGFAQVYLSTILGSTLGFMSLFWLGARLGRSYFVKRDYWLFKADDLIKAELWFRKYGYLLILMNRFLPGIRSVISISAGISGLKPAKAAFFALLSCSVWNLIWIAFGYTIGSNWPAIKLTIAKIMSRYNVIVLSLVGVAIVLVIIRAHMRSRKEP